MAETKRTRAQTFYLNEQHELARAEKEGGRTPNYAPIDWGRRGNRIASSLQRLRKKLDASDDPVKENHFFLLANPAESLKKISKNERRAVDGVVTESIDFAKDHSRVFDRLGIDLLRVTDEGSAVVHVKPEILEQLAKTSHSLADFGKREQARWVTLEDFSEIPVDAKLDSDWISSLSPRSAAEAVLEFQPLLTRSEIDRLIRAIADRLKFSAEGINGTGMDYSGRQWLKGKLLPGSMREIVDAFFSVQSLHNPLVSYAASGHSVSLGSRRMAAGTIPSSIASLPSIAVVDTGVVADHAILAPYIRGRYVAPNSMANNPDTHGCFVASRVVFGDLDLSDGSPTATPPGTAKVFDVNVSGIDFAKIDNKGIFPALQAVVGTAPDVRVFNLSFDTAPLSLQNEIERAENLSLVQDLDNFIFQNDIAVIVAAGNSPPGLIPSRPYPSHYEDDEWQLGAWARGFNSVACGSVVRVLATSGLVTTLGWPSAFSRVGPGISEIPKPDFVAHGGNSDANYQLSPGLGVWGLSPASIWEDRSGTSHAAPLLSREFAFALRILEAACERGARPFAILAKAFLALTAEPSSTETEAIAEFFKVAAGMGVANSGDFGRPTKNQPFCYGKECLTTTRTS